MKRRDMIKLTGLSFTIAAIPSLYMMGKDSLYSVYRGKVFFDKNHFTAHSIAQAMFKESSAFIPIESDPTDLWVDELNEISNKEFLALAGVTTETFFFCLQQLLSRQCNVHYEVFRVNRDLFTWQINSSPKKNDWRVA